MRVLYLGISGVLHPSASTYELVEGRSPWADGHAEYEAVPWLSQTLEQWPDVQIVLTSTQPWKHGLRPVLARLTGLAARVMGFTYEDLTTKAVRQLRTRGGTTRQLTRSGEDYWRMNKSHIVAEHVEWLKPRAWVAVDDEDILWSADVRDHVVIVDGCKGLKDSAEQDRLLTYLHSNFGPDGPR
jgi:HAD domain in Swiss Army Knife RNA repair proteins